jgi:G:T-mismatch repair DNA endonuclease (very short patch repair protein)
MGVFDILSEKPAEVSRGDGCVWYIHGKTCWSQSKRRVCLILSWKNLLNSVEAMGVFDIVMEKPAEVSRSDGCVWYSHGITYWSPSKRWVCLIFSWKNLLKSVEAMGVFDIFMEKPAEVSRSDGCVWYSHGKTCRTQSKRWVCLI